MDAKKKHIESLPHQPEYSYDLTGPLMPLKVLQLQMT